MQRLFLLTGLIFISPGTIWGQSHIADTPWGHPSLEGLWSNETLTSFERPQDQADREYITIPLERRSGQKIYEYACQEGAKR